MENRRKKIGIMGGTFDPIHVGHLILGEKAYEQLGLDKILFMPAGNPPHKRNRNGRATDEQRTEMVRLAIEGNPHFELSLIEMNAEGFTYTYRTLERLKEQNPDTDYYFIIGADSLYNFTTWMEPSRICRACTIVVATRDHVPVKNLDQEMTYLSRQYGGCFIRLNTLNIDISSQLLRQWHQEGKSIHYYVPEAVVDYIEKHQIYHFSEMGPVFDQTEGDTIKMADYDFIKMQKKLAKYLDEDRFAHTLGVMYTCASLAMVHGYDLKDAQVAGLLHDSAKCIPNKKKLKMCEEHKIPVTEFEKTHPFLLHAKLGAYVAEAKYGIRNREILSSITYHTTGKPEMSVLEKSYILRIISSRQEIKHRILQRCASLPLKIWMNVCMRFLKIPFLILKKTQRTLMLQQKKHLNITAFCIRTGLQKNRPDAERNGIYEQRTGNGTSCLQGPG